MTDYVPDRYVRFGIKTTVDGRVAQAIDNELQRAGWTDREIEAAFVWYQNSGTRAGQDPQWAAASFAYAMERNGVSLEKIEAAYAIREKVNSFGYLSFAWDDPEPAAPAGLIGGASEPATSIPASQPAGLLTGPGE